MNISDSLYGLNRRELRFVRFYFEQRIARRHRIILASYLILAALIFIYIFGTINTKAASESMDIKFKYFTSIDVETGDSLWDIAKEHADLTIYDSVDSYIAEVC
ncbi:MAG: hypothetical protein K6F84_07255, partial [Lachnospiraceae bacterium]|nr:hypothetical protein [Lachnospiraceae bacterium]